MKRYFLRFLIFLAVVSIVFGIFRAGSYVCFSSQKTASEYQLPIIMYHHILKDESRHGEFIISPDDLERDLKYIKSQGYKTITDTDLIAYKENGTALPEKPIMLTFDDGHLSYLEYVVPLLEKHNMKALVSIVGSYTNDYTEHPDKAVSYAYLSWEDVKKLSQSDHTRIGNHTYDMHKISTRNGCSKMRGESSDEFKKLFHEDASKMRNLIYDYTGVQSDCFTYPFGYFCEETEEEIKKLGLKLSLTCTEGINYISSDSSLFKLKRFNRTHKRSVKDILVSAS